MLGGWLWRSCSVAGDEAKLRRQGESLGLPLYVESYSEVDWWHPSTCWRIEWPQWGVHPQMRGLVQMVGVTRMACFWAVHASLPAEGRL